MQNLLLFLEKLHCVLYLTSEKLSIIQQIKLIICLVVAFTFCQISISEIKIKSVKFNHSAIFVLWSEQMAHYYCRFLAFGNCSSISWNSSFFKFTLRLVVCLCQSMRYFQRRKQLMQSHAFKKTSTVCPCQLSFLKRWLISKHSSFWAISSDMFYTPTPKTKTKYLVTKIKWQ